MNLKVCLDFAEKLIYMLNKELFIMFLNSFDTVSGTDNKKGRPRTDVLTIILYKEKGQKSFVPYYLLFITV
jgi:hypothetical protein